MYSKNNPKKQSKTQAARTIQNFVRTHGIIKKVMQDERLTPEQAARTAEAMLRISASYKKSQQFLFVPSNFNVSTPSKSNFGNTEVNEPSDFGDTFEQIEQEDTNDEYFATLYDYILAAREAEKAEADSGAQPIEQPAAILTDQGAIRQNLRNMLTGDDEELVKLAEHYDGPDPLIDLPDDYRFKLNKKN